MVTLVCACVYDREKERGTEKERVCAENEVRLPLVVWMARVSEKIGELDEKCDDMVALSSTIEKFYIYKTSSYSFPL